MEKEVRNGEEFWTTGRDGRVVCVTAILYEDGSITATADEDKITERQLAEALQRAYPGHEFVVRAICGRRGADAYYIVDGTPATPTPRPEADEGSAAVNPEIKRDYPDYGGRYG